MKKSELLARIVALEVIVSKSKITLTDPDNPLRTVTLSVKNDQFITEKVTKTENLSNELITSESL